LSGNRIDRCGAGSKAELDKCAGVRHQLSLPSIVGLKLHHCGLGLGVPVAAGSSGEVSGADEGALDLGGALIVDGFLALEP